jgi:glutathione synthase/RimK-type ligase-like ATP-grasp enzyme
MKKIIWLYPERDTASQLMVGEHEYWGVYREGATMAGMQFLGGFSPEAVDVVTRPGAKTQVYVDNHPVEPQDAIFVTDLYLYPYAMQDAWSQLSLSWVLRQAGFYLPVSPELTVLVNDKLASILFAAETGLPVLPTTRLTTGRDWDRRDLVKLTEQLTFPIAVRPCNWGGGWGFTIARDRTELAGLLSLAAGSDTIMLLQPCLDAEQLIDYRVVCIDSEPTIAMVRKPAPGQVVANMTRGGRSWLAPVPDQLVEPARRLADRIDTPYLCVDFLTEGDDYWFSEMEADGSVTSEDRTEDEATLAILRDRFLAFDRAHERWLRGASSKSQIAPAVR